MTSDNPTAAEGLAAELEQMTPGFMGAVVAAVGARVRTAAFSSELEQRQADFIKVQKLADLMPTILAALRRPIPAGDDLDCGAMDIAELGHFVEAHRSTPTDTTAVEDEREAYADLSAIQLLDHKGPRIETGAVQFGDDWPGVFIRGDNAAYAAMNILALLTGKHEHQFVRGIVAGFVELLLSSQVGDDLRNRARDELTAIRARTPREG